MRKGKFGDEECASSEDKVGAHDWNVNAHERIGPVCRGRDDYGEKEAGRCCPDSTGTCTGSMKW